jgi:hypothetical protein
VTSLGTGMGAGPPARPQSGQGFELIPPESEQNVCHPAGGSRCPDWGWNSVFRVRNAAVFPTRCRCASVYLALRTRPSARSARAVIPGGRDRNPVGIATRARAGTRITFGCLSGVLALTLSRSAVSSSEKVAYPTHQLGRPTAVPTRRAQLPAHRRRLPGLGHPVSLRRDVVSPVRNELPLLRGPGPFLVVRPSRHD